MPVFQFHVSFGEAEGGLGPVEPQGAEARGDHGRDAVGRDRRAPAGPVRLGAARRSGRRSSPARRSTSLLNAQRIDTVIVTRLHDVGLRPRDDRRRVLERLPHARARGRRGRPGAGPARREPARLPAPLLRGHDDRRVHRVPAAPRGGMRRPPLEDVTIVAIEQYGAGPWGSVHLADLGADVIKIEDPRSRRRRRPLRAAVPGGRGLALLRDVLPQQAQRLARPHATPRRAPVFEDLVRAADAVYSNLRGDGPEQAAHPLRRPRAASTRRSSAARSRASA